MSRVGEDVDIDFLIESVHLRLKLVHVGDGNAFVLPAKNAEYLRMNLLQRGFVAGQVSVVDDGNLQPGIGDRQIVWS